MNVVLQGAYPIKVSSNGPPDPNRNTRSHDVSNFAHVIHANRDI